MLLLLLLLSTSLQARASFCQRSFTTAASLTAMCSDPTSPLSPTYWAELEFPARPAASQLNPVTVTSLRRQDLNTGVWAQLDPQTDLAAPAAAVGPPVMCSGVSLSAAAAAAAGAGAAAGAAAAAAEALLNQATGWSLPTGCCVLAAMSGSLRHVTYPSAKLMSKALIKEFYRRHKPAALGMLLLLLLLPLRHQQVVVETHFLMRTSTDAETGALQLAAVQLSLVIADVAMPAAGPLVVNTGFSVTWANASVAASMLQVCGWP